MTLLALLRHADTAWSVEGRIQGHSDVPLSVSGREQLRGRVLPPDCSGMKVVTSPLARCVETAVLLGAPDAEREPRIAEMHWGAWEGRLLAELRQELGEAMRQNEARGLDFRPEGGESPRELLFRVSMAFFSFRTDFGHHPSRRHPRGACRSDRVGHDRPAPGETRLGCGAFFPCFGRPAEH
jgi:broad specificity phosphatase PhoE